MFREQYALYVKSYGQRPDVLSLFIRFIIYLFSRSVGKSVSRSVIHLVNQRVGHLVC